MKYPEDKLTRLIQAAIKYADLSEKQITYEENKTKTLQHAANLAREGKHNESIRILQTTDMHPVVFDFTDVKKDLIKAVKPFKGKY